MSGKAVRETLAALGVIASLVFVGAEIRQNTAATRGQTRQALFESSQDWLKLRSTDAAFDDLFYRRWTAPEEPTLTEGETRMSTNMMRWMLRRLENVYLQYSEGFIPEAALDTYGFEAGSVWFTTQRFREWWGNARRGYDPAFVSFLEAQYDLAP